MSFDNVKLDDLLNKATKYAEQNPIIVGASAVGALAAGLFVFRKAELSRDGKDFESSLTGGFKILNNTDHTLKTSEFSSSIENYEGQFKGARRATGAITSEESVEERKKRYADMVCISTHTIYLSKHLISPAIDTHTHTHIHTYTLMHSRFVTSSNIE